MLIVIWQNRAPYLYFHWKKDQLISSSAGLTLSEETQLTFNLGTRFQQLQLKNA